MTVQDHPSGFRKNYSIDLDLWHSRFKPRSEAMNHAILVALAKALYILGFARALSGSQM